MYRGHFRTKIDDKGRASVPARFREGLASSGSDDLCVTNFVAEDRYPCLDVYPLAQWLELERRLREPLDRSPRVISFFQNFYIPGVQECQVDRQGRILLCSRLREFANLDREVVFAGMGMRMRIFNVENWNAVFQSGRESLIGDPLVVAAVGV